MDLLTAAMWEIRLWNTSNCRQPTDIFWSMWSRSIRQLIKHRDSRQAAHQTRTDWDEIWQLLAVYSVCLAKLLVVHTRIYIHKYIHSSSVVAKAPSVHEYIYALAHKVVILLFSCTFLFLFLFSQFPIVV